MRDESAGIALQQEQVGPSPTACHRVLTAQHEYSITSLVSVLGCDGDGAAQNSTILRDAITSGPVTPPVDILYGVHHSK
jgi:hypothetical protein